jgi:hypothetical protein
MEGRVERGKNMKLCKKIQAQYSVITYIQWPNRAISQSCHIKLHDASYKLSKHDKECQVRTNEVSHRKSVK